MKLVVPLLLVLTLAGTGVCKEDVPLEAPSEAQAATATKNLLVCARAVKPKGGGDLLSRFTLLDGAARRLFGDAWSRCTPAQREEARFILRGRLFTPLFALAKLLEEYDTDRFTFAEGAEGIRIVKVPIGRHVVELHWVLHGGVPMLIDTGSNGKTELGALASKWRASGKTETPNRFLREPPAEKGKRAQITLSKDNIRCLLTYMIARVASKGVRGWPPYSGKNFVLYLVATRMIDSRDARNLEVLFSPARGERARPGPETYKEVTKSALKSGRDFSNLTDYAGRRNAEPAYTITVPQMKRGTPVVADVSFPDVAIVGFSSGEVKTMTRKELGLEPGDPIVVGEASKSELLRMLSDK